MSSIKVATPKGFRDFLPETASAREFVVGKMKEVFRRFGFEPLETPALEFAETLKGKYGEEEKLIYEFTTKGGDQVALRYDQTVPLARVIAQYPELPKPFKRYQIQSVWRGENPQKGRFREFLQCDADIVGSSSPLADAEILNLALEIYKNLGLDITIKVNDRSNFEGLDKKYVSAIDKLEKIGESEVLAEMVEKGMSDEDARGALSQLQSKPETENIKQIMDLLKQMKAEVSKVKYEPTLARGLDYYTGIIFEVVVDGYSGSLCAGGRWDKMIGPAVGFGLGFDRTLELLQQQNLIPSSTSSAKVLVTVFNPKLLKNSIQVADRLRAREINTELWLDPESKLDKQLKYADQKKIPYVIIIGPDEVEKGMATLKDLSAQTQETLTLDEAILKLSS